VPYFGGSLGQSSAPDRGIFAALDVTTNRLVWRQQWAEPCYSGSVVTAGGLVFTGRSDGRLTALDKATGEMLWEFMTDAGVNSTVTTFEHEAEQYVVVHAGGGVFANGARGDGIWLFSLNGTIEPVTPERRPGGFGGGSAAAAAEPTRPADPENGERIYREACLPCHGRSGGGGEGGGPSLEGVASVEAVMNVTAAGRNNMPAFGGTYSADELNDVATYIVESLAGSE